MQTVFIAGASGYLGRYLCAEYRRRGCYVTALVRSAAGAAGIAADQLVEAEATVAESLSGAMDGARLVVSCLGMTRQADGLDYADVDYGANLNLLREAERAGVDRFAYVHVVNAAALAQVPMVAAKSAFVRELQDSPVADTVIAPTGYFSDMGDFLAMARRGRVWLFGDGQRRLNPIHGQDLAVAIADAVAAGRGWCDVGGPDVLTQARIAEMAFAALGRPPRIAFLPDVLRRAALRVLPWITPRRIHGPATFFLRALALDMIGEPHGHRRLAEHFGDLAAAVPARTPVLPQGGRIVR